MQILQEKALILVENLTGRADKWTSRLIKRRLN
jgi:hypothetical protein